MATATLAQLVDKNSLFGDIGTSLINESVEDAVRKSTAGPGAEAAAEILKSVLRSRWVRHVLQTVPDATYKVVAMAIAGVVQNKIDGTTLDSDTKLVLKHAVNPLVLGIGKGASDASAARRRFGQADIDRIVEETVGGIRTADLANTPPSQRTGRIDFVAHTPLLAGAHLVKIENGAVATYPDGQPVLLCRGLRDAKQVWDANHPAVSRRQGQGQNARNVQVQATPFPMWIDPLEDAVLIVGDDDCPYCHAVTKMTKKVEANKKSIFEEIGETGVDKLLAICRAAARSMAISEVEAAGLMDEVKNVDKTILVRALAGVTVVNGVVSEEDARTFFVVVRGFGEGKLDFDEWLQLQGSRLWRQVQDPNVQTPPFLVRAWNWMVRGLWSYGMLAVVGFVLYAYGLLFATDPRGGWFLFMAGFASLLVFLSLFRPIQDLANGILTRVPFVKINPFEGLVRVGREFLAWFAFNGLIGGALLYFALPIEYRHILVLITLPGVVFYAIMDRMSVDPASTWRSRNWNASSAIKIRNVVALSTMGLCAHATWVVLAREGNSPQLTTWVKSHWLQLVGLVDTWSGLAGMTAITVLMLVATHYVAGFMKKSPSLQTLSTVSMVGLLALFWVAFIGMKTYETGKEAYAWATEEIETSDAVQTTFTLQVPPHPPASRKASPKATQSEDQAQKAFRELCAEGSARMKRSLGCPGS